MSTGATSWAFRVAGTGMDELSDALTIAGIEVAGISEDSGVTTAWFPTRPDSPMPVDGTWEEIADTDWSQQWRAWLRPVTVGRVTVSPPWLAPDGPVTTGEGPLTVVVEPGMAFGTGHHETTAGCLDALQHVDLAGRRVIDVGTGTAILAIAAVALGAACAEAVDTDPEAIEVATQNVAAHGMADRIRLAVGSCDVVQAPGHVVLANIITDRLLAIAADLVPLVAPGGTLITSGIGIDRTDEAVSAFSALGLQVEARPGREWTLLTGRRG